jgi:cytochrome c oxidase subunit 2
MGRRFTAPLLLLALTLAAGGCGRQSPLDPRSGPAKDIATLWWWMLGVAAVVLGGALVMLLISWLGRSREGLPLAGDSPKLSTGLVVVFGIVIPVFVLVAVFVVANFAVLSKTDAPRAATTAMTIEVTGHQWFWEVRYPGHPGAVTANEIHIPARTRVNVVAKSDDVIHSFWVPQLNRKIDMVPGHPNRVLLYADRPGLYRGQCAEFCGLQHAHMATYVYADPPDRFRSWLDHMARPRTRPTTPGQRRGERVFLSNQCASCHTIRGTPARGQVGPDLTHLKSRSTLAALTIPNRKGDLARWVLDPQHVKPGNKMPALDLGRREFHDLLDYLESLR